MLVLPSPMILLPSRRLSQRNSHGATHYLRIYPTSSTNPLIHSFSSDPNPTLLSFPKALTRAQGCGNGPPAAGELLGGCCGALTRSSGGGAPQEEQRRDSTGRAPQWRRHAPREEQRGLLVSARAPGGQLTIDFRQYPKVSFFWIL